MRETEISDAALLARAGTLQAEGAHVLRVLRLEDAFAGFGPAQVVGSMVSGLMVWRDLDVVFTAPHATAVDVFTALARLATVPGLIAVDYRDEREQRRPTDRIEDERHYLVCRYEGAGGLWKVDITVWLHAVERPTLAEAEHLAAHVTSEQRLTILRLKDLWHRSPHYPYRIGGTDIYDAVLHHSVRSPEDFSTYLRVRDLPISPHEPH
ncbi:hypothetical protein Aph01nite_05860 [Acrocarpospora phusangensis]|uniref:Uncharacterized protein n=1 Tax=Acrocarpospora phusangensis TaxID=1070424 RepID=A0A919UI45_9ACTN|nr:hypothetical protein [Acrocarpospora phusangensis]GIH22276.1 hypothetical protein Aph01nite_05860 [Acrocarpospora phusangensis]